MNAAQSLDLRIKTTLQGYLGSPFESRTREQYDRMVDDLNHAAIDYAESVLKERAQIRKQTQRYQ